MLTNFFPHKNYFARLIFIKAWHIWSQKLYFLIKTNEFLDSIFSPGDIHFHEPAANPYENCANKSCVVWMGEPNTAGAPHGVLTAHVA